MEYSTIETSFDQGTPIPISIDSANSSRSAAIIRAQARTHTYGAEKGERRSNFDFQGIPLTRRYLLQPATSLLYSNPSLPTQHEAGGGEH